MRLARTGLLLLLLAPAGCDVIVAAAASRNRGNGDDDAAASAPATYRVWIAQLADASAERDALAAANGTPSPAVWTFVGSGTASALFDPFALPGSFNAILIQTTAVQNYAVDAIEIMDSLGVVIETASGTTYSDLVTLPDNILGTPNGIAADTAAVSGADAFLFTVYAQAIEQFRVNAWSTNRAAGDVNWVLNLPLAARQTPGGAALDSAGNILFTMSDGLAPHAVRLLRVTSAGSLIDITTIASGVSMTSGSHAVAVDSPDAVDPNEYVYVAATVADGNILVSKLNASLATVWTRTIDSLLPRDTVEANGLAVVPNNGVLVSGGLASAVNGINHWTGRFDATGLTMWEQVQPVDDPQDTYWQAVALADTGFSCTAGDITQLAMGAIQTFARRTAPDGTVVWSSVLGDAGIAPDRLNAVTFDSAGSAVAGGFFGTSAQGRDAVVMRYSLGGVLLSLITHNGPSNGNDEILDVAIDTADGALFVTGYESAAGQGENFWVRAYNSDGSVRWTRTVHGGTGSDNGVSLVVTSTQVVVVGYHTLAGPNRDVHIRSYAK